MLPVIKSITSNRPRQWARASSHSLDSMVSDSPRLAAQTRTWCSGSIIQISMVRSGVCIFLEVLRYRLSSAFLWHCSRRMSFLNKFHLSSLNHPKVKGAQLVARHLILWPCLLQDHCSEQPPDSWMSVAQSN